MVTAVVVDQVAEEDEAEDEVVDVVEEDSVLVVMIRMLEALLSRSHPNQENLARRSLATLSKNGVVDAVSGVITLLINTSRCLPCWQMTKRARLTVTRSKIPTRMTAREIQTKLAELLSQDVSRRGFNGPLQSVPRLLEQMAQTL